MPTEVPSSKSKVASKSLTSRLGIRRKSISQPLGSKPQHQPISVGYSKGQSNSTLTLTSIKTSATSTYEKDSQYSPSQYTISELPSQHASQYPIAILRSLHPELALDASTISSARSSRQVDLVKKASSSTLTVGESSSNPDSRRSSFNKIVNALSQGLLLDLPEMHTSDPVLPAASPTVMSAIESEYSQPSPMPIETSLPRIDATKPGHYQPSIHNKTHESLDLERSSSASSVVVPIASTSWISSLTSLARERSVSSIRTTSFAMSRDDDETLSQDFMTRLPAGLDTDSIASAPWLHEEEPEEVNIVINTRMHSRLRSSSRRSHKSATEDPHLSSRDNASQLLPSPMESESQRSLQYQLSRDSLASADSNSQKVAKAKSVALSTKTIRRPPRSMARSQMVSQLPLRTKAMLVDTCLADTASEADIQWEMLNDASATIKEYKNALGITTVQYSDKIGAIERWRSKAEAFAAEEICEGVVEPFRDVEETIQEDCFSSADKICQPTLSNAIGLPSATSEFSLGQIETFQSMSSMAPTLFTAPHESPKLTSLIQSGRSLSSPGFSSRTRNSREKGTIGQGEGDEASWTQIPGTLTVSNTSDSFFDIRRGSAPREEVRQDPNFPSDTFKSPGMTVMSDPTSDVFESADEGKTNVKSGLLYSPAQRIRAEVLSRQSSAQKRISMQLGMNEKRGAVVRSTPIRQEITHQQSTFDLTKDQLMALSEELEAGNLDTMELQRRYYNEGANSSDVQSDLIPTPDLSRESCISKEEEEEIILTPQSTSWQLMPETSQAEQKEKETKAHSSEINIIDSEFASASGKMTLLARPTIPIRRRSKRTSIVKHEAEPARKRLRAPSFLKHDSLPIQLVEPPTQTSWRMEQSRESFEEFSATFGSKEMHRQEVIEELRVTEMNFVINLNSILRIFSLPLRCADTMLFREDVPLEVARLFNSLDDILSFHYKILRTLDKVKTRHPSALIVSVAGAFHRHIPGLAVYQSYLVNFERVTRLIEDVRQSSNKGDLLHFEDIIDRQSALPECRGLSLSSFLLKPVQRLMKYPLFFKQLAELTPSDHPDYRDTIQLCAMTEKIIRDMNCVKAREEDYQEMKMLQERIKGLPEGFHLASRQRRLLKQGVLYSLPLSEMEKKTSAQYALQRSISSSSSSKSVSPQLRSLELQAAMPSVPLRNNALMLLSPDMSRQSSLQSTPGTSSQWCNSPAESNGDSSSYIESKSVSNLSLASVSSTLHPHETKKQHHQQQQQLLQQPPPRPASRKSNKTGLFSRAQSYNKLMASAETMNEAEHLYAFLFDDVLLLTTVEKDTSKGKNSSSSSRKRGATIVGAKGVGNSPVLPQGSDEQLKYNLLPHGGISRIIGVTSRSAKGDATAPVSALEIEVLPLQFIGQKLRTSGASGSSTFLFTFADENHSKSTSNQGISPDGHDSCQQWEKQFENSFMNDIQSRKRQSMMMHNDMASPLFAAILPPQPSAAPAQVEWLSRREKVTEMIMNAASCGDRTTLVATLQAGLPFPRSPSQQNLSDSGSRIVSAVEKGDYIKRNKLTVTDQSQVISSENTIPPTPKTLRKIPSQSHLHTIRRSPASTTLAHRESINLVEIAKIGDLGDSTDAAHILDEEKREEKAWWKLRLKEIEVETIWNEEIEKLMGTRRSRVAAMIEAEEATTFIASSSSKSTGKLSMNKYGSFNAKVRKGVPVHRY